MYVLGEFSRVLVVVRVMRGAGPTADLFILIFIKLALCIKKLIFSFPIFFLVARIKKTPNLKQFYIILLARYIINRLICVHSNLNDLNYYLIKLGA